MRSCHRRSRCFFRRGPYRVHRLEMLFGAEWLTMHPYTVIREQRGFERIRLVSHGRSEGRGRVTTGYGAGLWVEVAVSMWLRRIANESTCRSLCWQTAVTAYFSCVDPIKVVVGRYGVRFLGCSPFKERWKRKVTRTSPIDLPPSVLHDRRKLMMRGTMFSQPRYDGWFIRGLPTRRTWWLPMELMGGEVKCGREGRRVLMPSVLESSRLRNVIITIIVIIYRKHSQHSL